MLERDLEKKCVNYAKKLGYFQLKLYGFKGIPDRLFVRNGKYVFVEFKSPKLTGVLSESQKIVIGKLKKQKCAVEVIDNFEDFKKIMEG